jgi:hypothetical protein
MRSLARGYTASCIKTLGGYANGAETDADIKLRAIGMLLDRGWGKPNQPHTDAEGGDLKIILRTIVDKKP